MDEDRIGALKRAPACRAAAAGAGTSKRPIRSEYMLAPRMVCSSQAAAGGDRAVAASESTARRPSSSLRRRVGTPKVKELGGCTGPHRTPRRSRQWVQANCIRTQPRVRGHLNGTEGRVAGHHPEFEPGGNVR